LRLKPDWVEPMNELAWILASNDKAAVCNPEKAVKLAQRACELTNFNKPEILDTLAVAYAAAGDFGNAVETAQKALDLCQSDRQQAIEEQIKSRLVLFKAGKPYVETQ
jgi:tetratricopeptide (TPR) repeat protein